MKRGVSYGKSADRRRGRSGGRGADPRDTQTTNLQVSGGSHPGVIHVPGDSMYRVTPAPSQGEMRPGGRSGGDGTVIPVTEKAVKRLAGITFNAINRNGQTSSDQRIEQAAGRCRSPPNLPCEQICNNDRQANRFKDIDQSVTSIHSTSHLLKFTLLTTYSYYQHHRHLFCTLIFSRMLITGI